MNPGEMTNLDIEYPQKEGPDLNKQTNKKVNFVPWSFVPCNQPFNMKCFWEVLKIIIWNH